MEVKEPAFCPCGLTVNQSSPSPPGVKDGVSLVSRDAKLNGPLTGGYIPAIHHAQPVRWVRKNTPLEPDQFADAE